MTIIVTGGAGFIGSNFFHMLDKYPDYRILWRLDCLTYAETCLLSAYNGQPKFPFCKRKHYRQRSCL